MIPCFLTLVSHAEKKKLQQKPLGPGYCFLVVVVNIMGSLESGSSAYFSEQIRSCGLCFHSSWNVYKQRPVLQGSEFNYQHEWINLVALRLQSQHALPLAARNPSPFAILNSKAYTLYRIFIPLVKSKGTKARLVHGLLCEVSSSITRFDLKSLFLLPV